MPRRAEPRLQVPAGSVGIGGAQTGIYPLSTPGGWQLIGLTPLKLFDPMREPPVLLRHGDSVRFVPQRREYVEYYSRGIYTSVQDSGRHGFRQSGLSHCGALDKPAFQTANLWSGTMRMPRCWKSLSVNWLSNLKMRLVRSYRRRLRGAVG